MTILTQQCFTRLHNTSNSIPEERKVDILNDFMKELKLSGYDEKDRYSILTGGIKLMKTSKRKKMSYMTFTAFDKRYLAITLYGPNRDDPDFYRKHVFNINNFPAHDFALWAGEGGGHE